MASVALAGSPAAEAGSGRLGESDMLCSIRESETELRGTRPSGGRGGADAARRGRTARLPKGGRPAPRTGRQDAEARPDPTPRYPP
ncbi:hypothetical protein GCM10009639_14720 [Kitasatospora putterlickiae]|uniref:Uncharacterized protein n=1 Tax=Kitasatospora putterlickiae TaxID=221725 RepID=A0ABN1XU26_9ACTN